MANETVHGVEGTAMATIRDEHLLALFDVLHGCEGHDPLHGVPGILGVPLGVACVVEV